MSYSSVLEGKALEGNIYLQDLRSKFGWIEYCVFAFVLCISAGIGIFYGFFSKRVKSKEEYLMGSRQMTAFPVALSLLCSFISAIAMLGNPMEVYYYGTQYFIVILSFIPMTYATMYIYVPVYFKLQLTSAYEYFEMRFSRSVRMVVSVINCIYLILYMALVVYAPSLALNQVTGFQTNLSVAIIFIVCIFYSSVGGFRAVLMSDAFQGIMMIGSVLILNIKGISDVGGFGKIWEKVLDTDRVEFFRFDADPRTRHSVWSVFLGGYFLYLTFFTATQANIQRYSSMPDMKTVTRALIINHIALTVTMSLIIFPGVIMFTRYYDCDPLTAELINASDQLVPFFMMDILGDYPVLPGIFVGGVTCAGLSSVSSGLSALAAVVTEDFVKPIRPDATDSFLYKVSRIVSVVSGLLSFGFVFVVQNMGNIYPVAISLAGMLLGPTLGLFTLGIIFPWANSIGSLLGVLSSYIVAGIFGIGASIAGDKLPNQKLSLSTTNCSRFLIGEDFENLVHLNHTHSAGSNWKEMHSEDSAYIKLVSVSYMYIPLIGCMGTIIFGLGFSYIISLLGWNPDKRVKRVCMNEGFVKFWSYLFPKGITDLLDNDDSYSKEYDETKEVVL